MNIHASTLSYGNRSGSIFRTHGDPDLVKRVQEARERARPLFVRVAEAAKRQRGRIEAGARW